METRSPKNAGQKSELSAAGEHKKLVNEVLAAIGSRPDVRVWSNNTGATKTESGGYVRFGLVGSGDIIGFTSRGQFINFEIKTGNARLSRYQQAFHRVCIAFGALSRTIRSVDEAVKTLDELNLPDVNLAP